MRTAFSVLVACAALSAANAYYNQASAIEYVWLSAAAYCASDTIESWDCGAPCQHIGMERGSITVAYNAANNVQAYVGRTTSGSVIVSFRGTESSSLKDWIDDLKFAKKTPYEHCDGCSVHDGFYESYTSLQSQILAGLNKIGVSPGATVNVAGHSLGAAMAALCAFDLKMKGYNIGQSFTFGEPRVGNPAFASAFESNVGDHAIYRVVHWRDIVPHLPLELMGFHHIPTEVWYNDNSSSYSVCNGSGEDSRCSDSLDIAISISDHLHYINIPISGSCSVSSFDDQRAHESKPASKESTSPRLQEPGFGLRGKIW